MKINKELTQGKAIAIVIIIYTILTILLGFIATLIVGLVSNVIKNMTILSTISVILSIICIYLSWKFSIKITLKNKSATGFNSSKMVKCFAIFLIIISVITIVFDVFDAKTSIENQYSNSFLEDKDVVNAFTEEELQERVKENEENMATSKKQAYMSIAVMDVLSLIINLLILSIVAKKTIEQYDGVVEIEKKVEDKKE